MVCKYLGRHSALRAKRENSYKRWHVFWQCFFNLHKFASALIFYCLNCFLPVSSKFHFFVNYVVKTFFSIQDDFVSWIQPIFQKYDNLYELEIFCNRLDMISALERERNQKEIVESRFLKNKRIFVATKKTWYNCKT